MLAAVRHQRGEAGVFEVLNDTREAHGLRRLGVPAEVAGTQLPSGAQQARIQQQQQRQQRHRNNEHMMDDDEEEEEAAGDDGEYAHDLDPADAVETMFRRLNVQHSQPHSHSQAASHTGPPTGSLYAQSATAASSASPSASFFSASAYPASASAAPAAHPGSYHQPHQQQPHQSSSGSSSSSYSHSYSPYSSSPFSDSSPFGAGDLDPSVDGPMRAGLTYPSLRTVLPALGAAPNSATRLELVHEPTMMHVTSPSASAAASSASAAAAAPTTAASAGASSSSSSASASSSPADVAAAAAAACAPLLSLQGREVRIASQPHCVKEACNASFACFFRAHILLSLFAALVSFRQFWNTHTTIITTSFASNVEH